MFIPPWPDRKSCGIDPFPHIQNMCIDIWLYHIVSNHMYPYIYIYISMYIYIIHYVKPPHVSVLYIYSTYLNHYTHIYIYIYGRFCVYTLSLTFASRRATRASETERQPRATQKRTHSWRVKRMKRWSHCSQCLGKIRENYPLVN